MRYDEVHAEFKLIGLEKSDREKKAKVMYLCREQYATLAEYLGGPEDVTYVNFKKVMLKRGRFSGNCFYCGQMGHREKRCPNKNIQANLVESSNTNYQTFVPTK